MDNGPIVLFRILNGDHFTKVAPPLKAGCGQYSATAVSHQSLGCLLMRDERQFQPIRAQYLTK